MSKPRSNSHWAQLNREQRELVEMWLFDERASYAEVCDRVKAQFGREVSLMSLSRFYQSRAPGRQVTDLLAAQSLSDAVAGEKLNTDSMRSAAVKIIAKSTLKLACEKPDELKNLGGLARVLLSSEVNDIRRGRLQLELSRFHHKTCGDVSDEIPKLARLLVTIEEDDALSEEEKIGKVHALLFPNSAQTKPQPAQV